MRTQAGEQRVSIGTGEALSSLTKSQLAVISEFLKDENTVINIEHVKALKKLCKSKFEITLDDVKQIAVAEKPSSPMKKRKISFDDGKLKTYCPNMSDEEIAELVYTLLEQRNVNA